MVKVSFIIPVYRVEEYLEQCVASILNQTYKNIEVILVDDGSPDNSPIICDSLKTQDDRIIVIHKKNGGSSSARNEGLSYSTGDYIIFVDSDDFWIDCGSLESLLREFKSEDLDFVAFNYKKYYSSEDKYITAGSYPDILQGTLDHNTAIIELVKSGTVLMSAWSRIIKREILVSNNILFKEGVAAEDFAWFIDLMEKTNRCKFINRYIYAYRQNVAGSITNRVGDKNFIDGYNYLEEQLLKINDREFSIAARDALLSFYAYSVCILIALTPCSSRPKLNISKLRKYYWLIDYDLNPKVHKAKVVKKYCGKWMMEVLLKLYINWCEFYNNLYK